MYLIFFLLFILMSVFWMKVLFNVSPVDSVGIVQLLMVALLYVAYCVNFLQHSAYLLIMLNICLFIMGILIAGKRKSLITELVCIGRDKHTYIYIGYLFLIFFVTYNRIPFWGDELRYWASVPKVLYQYDGALQLKDGYQLFSVDYIPGISVYQYFLQILNGNWNDSLLFFGYGAIVGAIVLPITKNTTKWYGVIIVVLVIFMLPLFFFHTKANDYAIFYQSLYIDPIVGLTAGYLSWLVLSGEWDKKITFIEYALCASFLCTIKSSGIVFVLITHMVVILYFLTSKKERKLSYKLMLVGAMALPIALWELWNILVKIYGVNKELNYNLGMFLNVSFLKDFFNALFVKSIITPWFYKLTDYFSFACCMVLLTLIALFVRKVLIKKKCCEEEMINCTFLALVIQVIVYVIGLYGLCVGTFEGRLNSYARYICTVCEMIAVFSICCMVFYYKDFAEYLRTIWNTNYVRVKAERTLCLGAEIAMVLILPIRPVNNYENTYPDYIVKDRQAVSEIFSAIRDSKDEDSWSTVTLLYDEPDWESESWVNWSKQWYGHLLNNLNYESIEYRTQIRQKHYYTSQMMIMNTSGGGSLELIDGDEWQRDIEYIAWLHGNYVETPIHDWELYKIIKIDDTRVDIEMVSSYSKPEEHYNYH